jgi:hypothetical protein
MRYRSFTIPSVYDDLAIHCRIYHPTCLAPTTVTGIVEWNKRAAIVAHPYAPLGGCYDDPVVDVVASTILKEGFIVGTFNFRYGILSTPWNHTDTWVEEREVQRDAHHGNQNQSPPIIYHS